MAKGFPYFKFVAHEWLTGNICFESLATQGLFINVCALYWQRSGELTVDEINKRFKKANALHPLINRYLHEKNGKISIHFLDEQLHETNRISHAKSENGKRGGRPKKQAGGGSKADAKLMQSKSKAKKSKEEEDEDIDIEREKIVNQQFFELFKRIGTNLSDLEIRHEVGKLRTKYPDAKPQKSGELISTWVANIRRAFLPDKRNKNSYV